MIKKPKPESFIRSAITIVLLLGAAMGLFLLINNPSSDNEVNNTNSTRHTNTDTSATPRGAETPYSTSNQPIPPTLKLTVPFTPQAPTANWDELHNEACEEASVIMAHAYFNDITSLPPAVVEREITKLTKWQQDNYGYYLSITTSETARMAREVYGLKTDIVPVSEQNIKQALANGNLVIFPAQGQMLGNPNFTAPGPVYHMFLITGYDANSFITNDPGTRNGKDYRYSYETLEAAAGNWSHTQYDMDLSDKRMIIVSK